MEALFGKGSSFSAYPVKLIYIETPVEIPFPAQAMFVAPKRSFKKAHDRNKLKRRMREIYRLNKNSMYENFRLKDKKLLMAFIYTSRKQEAYAVMETAMLKLINNVMKAGQG